jgi:hypothetical protein
MTISKASKRKRSHRKGASSSKDVEWSTPLPVRAALDHFGPIGLDPCSNAHTQVRARTRILLGHVNRTPQGSYIVGDGTAIDWAPFCAAHGYAFVNPPYGKLLRQRWAPKIAAEAAAGVEIIALVPARVDTEWWRTISGGAAAVGFVRGRLCFELPDHTEGEPAFFPSAIVYHGARAGDFMNAFAGIADCFPWAKERPAPRHWNARILTPSGILIDLQRPAPHLIEWTDVAHALNRVRRFGGMVAGAFNVAEHSAIVASIVERAGGSPLQVRAGLLHDATEAYLGDVIGPLKPLLPSYLELEARWAAAIERAAELPAGSFYDPLVEAADRAALVAEWMLGATEAQIKRQDAAGWGPKLEAQIGSSMLAHAIDLSTKLAKDRPVFAILLGSSGLLREARELH